MILSLLALLTPAFAEEADPRLWMEEVTGEAALQWVRSQNDQTVNQYAHRESFVSTQARILAALNSDDRIPFVSEMGGKLYNFWQDGAHVQGLWRRTTWESYRSENPVWETVLDLDALSKAEGQTWVWHGANCLAPERVRCLVQLSPGGSDADVVREFDLSTLKFVDGGFTLPLAKSDVDWLDINTVLVGTDLGEGSLTDSGYPRVTRRWSRGTPISAATPLFEGQKTDVAVSASHDEADSRPRTMVNRAVTFYTNEVYEVTKKGLAKVDKPDDCDATVDGDFIYFQPRSDWTVGGTVYRGGSLLRAPYKAWKKGKRAVEPLFTPTDTTSLSGWSLTPNTIVLEILDNVRTRVELLREGEGGLVRAPLAGLPALGDIGVWPVNGDERDTLFVTTTDYLTPSTLSLTEPDGSPAVLKRSPSFFSAEGLAVSQHFATSKDGTRVPYFEVAPKQIPAGGLPTLLYGYGGFEVSLTPGYSAAAGIAWMERGGVYVVANIRGGGEYGPRWHQAALREKRHKAYEDFAAVGEDLVKRGVTTPKQLGIMGGSNGGLLMGNAYTRYPDHWGAVVCQVPLLDMKRYTKLLAGASWAGEYGDPDVPADWAFLQAYSPYHQVDPAKDYPPILFTTSTRDDRVHPGHARKMAHLLLGAGEAVSYYENIEGGHGGAANNAQQAFMRTLGYEFLWDKLKPAPPPPPAPAPVEVAPPAPQKAPVKKK